MKNYAYFTINNNNNIYIYIFFYKILCSVPDSTKISFPTLPGELPVKLAFLLQSYCVDESIFKGADVCGKLCSAWNKSVEVDLFYKIRLHWLLLMRFFF